MSVPEKVVSQMAELSKEAIGLRYVVEKEASEKQGIIRSIERIQRMVKADIKLSEEAIANFKGFREGHLDARARLSLLKTGGGRVSMSLDSLDGEEFLSVITECTPKLLDLLGAKEAGRVETRSVEVYRERARSIQRTQAEAKPVEIFHEKPRIVQTKEVAVRPTRPAREETKRVEADPPDFSVRISLEGGRLAIFDWRSYHVSIMNQGGGAREIRILARLPTLTHQYKPFNLSQGAETNLDLRRFHRLARTESIRLEVKCKAADLREFAGRADVSLEGKSWQRLSLRETRGTSAAARTSRRASAIP